MADDKTTTTTTVAETATTTTTLAQQGEVQVDTEARAHVLGEDETSASDLIDGAKTDALANHAAEHKDDATS